MPSRSEIWGFTTSGGLSWICPNMVWSIHLQTTYMQWLGKQRSNISSNIQIVKKNISALFNSPSWICSLLNKDRYDIQILKIMHYLVHMAKIIGSQLIKWKWPNFLFNILSWPWYFVVQMMPKHCTIYGLGMWIYSPYLQLHTLLIGYIAAYILHIGGWGILGQFFSPFKTTTEFQRHIFHRKCYDGWIVDIKFYIQRLTQYLDSWGNMRHFQNYP